MKITDIKTHVLRQELAPGDQFAYAQSWYRTRNALVVEVFTDEGIVGLGEAYEGPSIVNRAIIDEVYRPLLVGADPMDTDVLWDRCYHRLRNHGRKGVAIEALSAVDIALWDILGKKFGVPAYKLLGGQYRDRVRPYATGLYLRQAADPVQEVAARAAGYVAQGFRAVKLGLGFGIEHDVARVRAVRQAIGPDVLLMTDFNQAYTAGDAARLGRKIETFDISWIEEPVPPEDLSGYREVKAAVGIPIAGGEVEYTRYGYRDLIAQRCVDVIQPDVTAVGGLTEAKKVIALASAWNIAFFPHGWVSAVGLFATLQLAAAIPPAPQRLHLPDLIFEYDRTPNPFRDDLAVERVEWDAGLLRIPDRPGLGVTLNRDLLERCAVR